MFTLLLVWFVSDFAVLYCNPLLLYYLVGFFVRVKHCVLKSVTLLILTHLLKVDFLSTQFKMENKRDDLN